jgi:hypothetical protein
VKSCHQEAQVFATGFVRIHDSGDFTGAENQYAVAELQQNIQVFPHV